MFLTYTAPESTFDKHIKEFEHVRKSIQLTGENLIQGSSDVVPKFVEYVNWPLGLKINHLQNWYYKEGEQDCVIIFYRPPQSRVDDTTDLMCIRQGKIPIGISINSSLTTEQLDILYKTIFPTDLPFNEDQIIDESDITTANGYKGFRFNIAQNETSEEEPGIVRVVKGTEFWIPLGDNMFNLEYFGQLATYDRYLPIAEKMVDSFKFLKDKNSSASESLQVKENLNVYDSEFFSVKYPSSWFVSAERGISDSPRASGVTLVNQIDTNRNNNRVTPKSHVEHSVIAISVLPKTAFPIDTSNFDISEILDSFINYSYSSQKLSESGDQLLTDNSTYLSGRYARSISYISNAQPGGTYNFMVFSTNRDSIYQIAYGASLSKYQKELSEVKSIISSFRFKEPKVSTVESPPDIDTKKIPFSTYSNSKYGVKLVYPKDWDVQEEVSEIVAFTSPSTSMTDFPEAIFSIFGTSFSQGRPHFEDFSNEQFKAYVTQLINFSMPHLNDSFGDFEYQILNTAKTTTDKGYLAFKLEFMINEMDPSDSSIIYQHKRLQIWIPQANNLYKLQYDAEPTKFSTLANNSKDDKFL